MIPVKRERSYLDPVTAMRRCARCEDKLVGFPQGRVSSTDDLMAKL